MKWQRRKSRKRRKNMDEEIDEEIENWAELRRKYPNEFLPWQELDA